MRCVCRCEGGWERQELCCSGVTAGSTETGKGSRWSQPVLFVVQELTQPIQNTSLHPLPLLMALLTLQGCLTGQPELSTAAASAEQRVCAGHRSDGTGPRFFNCPALVVFLPDRVFRVGSSLQRQQKTDQVQLLLALLPVFPLVLNCVHDHSFRV